MENDKVIISMYVGDYSSWIIQRFDDGCFTVKSLEKFSLGSRINYIIGNNTSDWIFGIDRRYSKLEIEPQGGGYRILLKFDENKVLEEEIELRKEKLTIHFGGEVSKFFWEGSRRIREGESIHFRLEHSWFCSQDTPYGCRRMATIPFELSVKEGELSLDFHNTTLKVRNEGDLARFYIKMLPPDNCTSFCVGVSGRFSVLPDGKIYLYRDPECPWPFISKESDSRLKIQDQDMILLVRYEPNFKPSSFLFITGKAKDFVPLWPIDLEVGENIYLCIGTFEDSLGEVSYPIYSAFEKRADLWGHSDPESVVTLVFAVGKDFNRLIWSILSPSRVGELKFVKGMGLYFSSFSGNVWDPSLIPVRIDTPKIVNQCYSGEDECGCGDLPAKEYFHILLLNDNLTQVKGGAVISRYYVFPVQAFETYDVSDNGVYFLQWDYNANYTGLKEKLRVSPPPEEHAWLLLFDPELKKLKRGITVSDYRSIYALSISPEGDVYVSGRGSKKYIFPSFRWIPDREREDGRIYTFIARLDKNLKKLKGIYLFDEPDLEISRLYYIDGRVYALGYDRKVLNPDKWRWRVKFSNFRIYELDSKLRRIERIVKIQQVRDYVKDRIEPLPERLLDVGDGLCLIGYIDSTDFPVGRVDIERPRAAGEQDIFAVFLDKDLKRRGASIEMGGRGKEDILDVGVDGYGRVYIYGITDSEDFNLKEPVYGIKYRGCRNPFVVRISPSSN